MSKTFGEWLFVDIHNNSYLNKLYIRLITQYTNKLLNISYQLSEKEITDMLSFADILSKSSDEKYMDLHKNISQNITTIIKKLYPDFPNLNYYIGSVLSNVNNYVGLNHQCPNYENSDLIDNVYENVCKELHRVPFCNKEKLLYFNNSQKIAFDTMRSASMYSFSGPTSMGKTFLIKTFIRSMLETGNKHNFVIIVPSKALINEIKNDFVKEFDILLTNNEYKVITTPAAITNFSSNYIMVYTQERFLLHLNEYSNLKVDYLFIDEAQKISEIGLRSAYFYKIIEQAFSLFPNLNLYFSCPNIPNPEVYFSLLPTSVQKKLNANSFGFSPVNQHKCIYHATEGLFYVYNDLSSEFEIIQYEKYSSLLEILSCIGKDTNNIVFLDSKQDVVSFAVKYASNCDNVYKTIDEKSKRKLSNLIEDVKKEIHPKCYLVDLLQKGVCYHVGYLPATIKEKIENLYKEKIIKTVFCTSTLLEGVNLPADNLFIGVKRTSYILKNSANFRNLIGRVGRKTYNLVGNVFVIPITEDSIHELVSNCEQLISQPVQPQSLSIDIALDEKIKRKIINCLVKGNTELNKAGISYEKFDLARFCLNILLKNIKTKKYNGTVFRAFKELLDKPTIEIIYSNFKEDEYVSDDSKITTDQVKNLAVDIKKGEMYYPHELSHKSILSFLEKLHEYFNWEKYESKLSIGKKSRLSYYATLMNKWMNGENVSQMINESISYYREKKVIYNEIERCDEPFVESPEQINQIIVRNLVDIEDVLLFQISNYFIKFSDLYKKILNTDKVPNDWSEYLDFGTNDTNIIYLQKIGFSREVAKLIVETPGYLKHIKDEMKLSTIMFEENNTRLIEELIVAKLNYPELFEDT